MYGGVGASVEKMMIKDKKGDVQDLIDFVAKNHSYQELKQEDNIQDKQRWRHARRMLLPGRGKKDKRGKRVKKNSLYENKKTRKCRIIDPKTAKERTTKTKQGITSKYLRLKNEEKGKNIFKKEECLLQKKVKRIRKAVQSGVYGYRTDSINVNDISSLPSNIIEVRVPPPIMKPRMSLKRIKHSRVHRNRRNKMIIKEELASRTATLQKRSNKSNKIQSF